MKLFTSDRDEMINFKINSQGISVSIAIALLLLLIFLIFTFNTNLVFIVLPFIILAILFIIGIRRPLHMLVIGAIMICAISPSISYADYHDIVDQEKTIVTSNDGLINNGTFTSDEWSSGNFHFSVQISEFIEIEEVRLHLVNTWEVGSSKNKYYVMNYVNSSDGILFYELDLSNLLEGIYTYNFIVITEQDTIITDDGFGPINADDDRIFMTSLYNGIFRTAIMSGFLFIVIIFLLWWVRSE